MGGTEFGLGLKKARLFWAKKVSLMTVPVGKSDLFFGLGLGQGGPPTYFVV